jgi:hypothetical protein
MYESHNLSIRTKISLGGTTRNHFAKNHTNKVGPNLKNKILSIHIGLFDWIRWIMFSPPMHTLMKNYERPKTYNMH